MGRGSGFPIPLGAVGRLGLPGVLVIVALIVVMNVCSGTDIDPGVGELEAGSGQPGNDPIPRSQDPDADLVDFVSFVLDDVQDEWDDLFRISSLTYRDAELVLFEGSTSSACGGASEVIGPHYCPIDERVYLDLDFFRELASRLGAPGDYAQAYVIAHEIGHHVQQVLGTTDRVRDLQRSEEGDSNELSIRLELQADCFAGVWGHSTFQRELLETGDLAEALGAASAVGDDRLQQERGGRVNPETWTHGSAEQRMDWFRRGFESGDPGECDTFDAQI